MIGGMQVQFFTMGPSQWLGKLQVKHHETELQAAGIDEEAGSSAEASQSLWL